ncbi:unnamed protein product [Didymodactylos carnosus]|uniref:Uncharacterized protein n=1 Tax=Didymodactylos carnosus TaxID=1234261 RepID=A0A8S2G3B8_9BILA|nr:unnamed protein product [Didymodactylos carnosus]CAF4430761.1 unnamed protein product [Didymodactylos carnosus]
MSNEYRVKRYNVDQCERDWAKAGINKNHTTVNNSKVLNNVNDGQRYLNGLGRILKIDKVDGGQEFIQTLCLNIEFDGTGATEFKQMEFRVGTKHGTATYLLVATNVDQNMKVTVCYSYHYIDEHLLSNKIFTLQATDMTLDWLRAKACESLKAMLPEHAAPKLIYE